MDFQVTDELLYKLAPLAAELEMEGWTTDFDIPFSPSEKYRRRMRRLLRQSHNPKLHYHYMSAAGRVAVVILAIVLSSVALTVTVKAVMEWRMNVKRVEHHIGYDETAFDISGSGKELDMEFTYIPEGYTLQDFKENYNSWYIKYSSESGEFTITVHSLFEDDRGFMVSDTDYISMNNVSVNNSVVQIFYKQDDWKKCFWVDGGYQFVLKTASLEDNEICNIIKGIQ